MHQVSGSRIIDTVTGKEVLWRGVGFSYLMHSGHCTAGAGFSEPDCAPAGGTWIQNLSDAIVAWQQLIPLLLQSGINTARLAFKFSWDTHVSATADWINTADFTNIDAVVKLLGDNGIKTILDQHGAYVPVPQNAQLLSSWVTLATHFRDNQNVIAYEIANEPSLGGYNTGGYTKRDNAQGYHDITDAIRASADPNKICIWESPNYYIPYYEDILDLMLQNVVYTEHRWWSYGPPNTITEVGAHELGLREFDSFLYDREKYNIPIWLGEFGGPGGGNPKTDYTYDDPWWAECAELLWNAETSLVGWNLWMGAVSITENHFNHHMPLLPPKNLNTSLVRLPLPPPRVQLLRKYIVTSTGVDSIYDYLLQMYHGNDSVTLNPGIKVKITRSHYVPPDAQGACPVGARRVVNATTGVVSCWEDHVEIIDIKEPTIITNYEGTTQYPGDWNLTVESVAEPPPINLFPVVLAGLGVLLGYGILTV